MRLKKFLAALAILSGIAAIAGIAAQSHESPGARMNDDARNHLLDETFPAVYTINVETTVTGPETPPVTSTMNWSGTGFGVTENGLVLTNKHIVRTLISDYPEPVLDGANTWRYQNGAIAAATFQLVAKDGTRYAATVVAVHPKADLALLAIEHPPLGKRFAALAFETGPILWDSVISIGAPFGLSFTVGEGIISNPAFMWDGSLLIQTTALVHPGNSGGPLILLKNHKVAGVTSTIYNPFGAFGIRIGFAVPASIADEFVRDAVKKLEAKKA